MVAHGFNHQASDNSKDEWLTPPAIVNALGVFDLDPCAPVNRPWDTAKNHYTHLDNGLIQPWQGRVWCNPPYGKEVYKWLSLCAQHGDAIALIFARTETKGFHREIWRKANSVFFFNGRLKFHNADGTPAPNAANAPSCLVAYGKENTIAIDRTTLSGYHVYLRG